MDAHLRAGYSSPFIRERTSLQGGAHQAQPEYAPGLGDVGCLSACRAQKKPIKMRTLAPEGGFPATRPFCFRTFSLRALASKFPNGVNNSSTCKNSKRPAQWRRISIQRRRPYASHPSSILHREPGDKAVTQYSRCREY